MATGRITLFAPTDDAFQPLIDDGTVETLQGSRVYVYSFFWKVFVNREKVVDANLRADNGIAHAIDGVLLPKAR